MPDVPVIPTTGGGTPSPNSKPLTNDEKNRWNKFSDFVKLQGVNPAMLDQKNKQVGMSLLQKYNMAYPQQAVDTNIVPRVQQGIQDYRNAVLGQWKAGKVVINGADNKPIPDESHFMPNTSPVDGWPGSKTLSYKFPNAEKTNPNGAPNTVVGLADPNKTVAQQFSEQQKTVK